MVILNWEENNLRPIAAHLLSGKPVVLPTDTLYGLVAKADNQKATERVYELKSRNPEKKCIVLISGLEDLKMFGIELSDKLREKLSQYWPGKVSVELPCTSEKYFYLRRGTDSLSFRFPDDELLCELLKQTGPLIAPSANPEGLEPAKNIEMAQEYFQAEDVLLVNAGEKNSQPSTLVSLLGESVEVLRGQLVPQA